MHEEAVPSVMKGTAFVLMNACSQVGLTFTASQ
jgi:hypothetical protein